MADNYTETPSDSIAIAESQAKEVAKPISDSVVFSDSEIESSDKLLDDSLSVSEAIAKAVIKPALVDSASLAESISKIAVMLGLTDSQAFSEAMAMNIGLGKTDTLGIAEAEAWFFNKIITDQITPFDDGNLDYDIHSEVWWGNIKWRTACHGGI